jgi:tRNA threonylcarbamoyl adenosine modification protein YeaZ
MKEQIARNVIIGFETGINGGSLSILVNNQEIECFTEDISITKSDGLLRDLDQLLKSNKIERSEIAKICISNGPGSVTGIRIGKSLAYGMGDSLGIEVFEISILDAMRFKFPKLQKVVTAFYSGDSKVYFKEFLGEKKENESVRLIEREHSSLELEDFIQELPKLALGSDNNFIFTEELVLALEDIRSGLKGFCKELKIKRLAGNFAELLAIAGGTGGI